MTTLAMKSIFAKVQCSDLQKWM